MLCIYILPILGLSVLAHAPPGIQIRDSDRGRLACGSRQLEESLRLRDGTGVEVRPLAQRDDLGLEDSKFHDDGSPISIDTYVTVIATGHDVQHGYVTQESIDKQLQILDDAFFLANVSFRQMEPRWYSEPSWWTSEDRDPGQKKRLMRAMLRQGSYKSLNLFYITELSPAGLIVGESYLPKQLPQDDEAYYIDGCMMASEQAPRIEEEIGLTGYTTVHQVGEWFGLGHLDRKNCDTDGEEYCPGHDPRINYMFPQQTEQLGAFTAAQLQEARASWFKYRVRPIPIVNGKNKILSKITWEHKQQS